MIRNVATDAQGLSSNAFLVAPDDADSEGDADAETRTALVDAGANFDAVAAVRGAVDGLDAVVLTHTHPDHVGTVEALRESFDIETDGFDPTHPAVDRPIEDGDRVVLGRDEYVALHTPGHAPDHLCLYAADPKVLFAGDLLFGNGAFGRTDLPGGDRRTLIESIDRVRRTVDEGLTALHAGHGPSVVDDPYRHVEAAASAARR